MKTYGPLPLQTFPYYAAIAAAKQQPRRDRLVALYPIVGASFALYEQNTANLADVGPAVVDDQQYEDLLDCYDGVTVPLRALKNDIEAHHNVTCPAVAAVCQYCGLTYGPAEFDHYLPKAEFPEFAALSLNLVPCCGRCNLLKDEVWLDAEGQRRIVSFYYDELPQTRFLYADVEVGDDPDATPLARFRLSDDPADYGGLAATVRSHFVQLQLLTRFKRAASAPFSDRKAELASVVQSSGIGTAAEMLVAKAQELSLSRSPNYWEVALLYGMAESAVYLNSLL